MKVLITGVCSGLGKELYKKIGGIGWSRQIDPQERKEIRQTTFDTIIHCAFNSSREITSTNLHNYLEDNLLLTNELLSILHRKFIYLSTVDLYPQSPGCHSEIEEIHADEVKGIYAITKLMSEAIVRHQSPNFLILRCVSLLGNYARVNTLIRMIQDTPCRLSLSRQSRFNFVLHSDVCDFIQFAIRNDLQGIYNLASRSNVPLSILAEKLGKSVNFGNHLYDVGNIDNNKISAVFPKFKKTSIEIAEEFIRTFSVGSQNVL